MHVAGLDEDRDSAARRAGVRKASYSSPSRVRSTAPARISSSSASAASRAGGPCTTGASAAGMSFASTSRSIVSRTPPAQSALAITTTADRVEGIIAFLAPKPLTPPLCCSTSTGPRSRIDCPQP
ncbi:MAG: hypothetical protein R2708_19635 [Vicinamibacterales bacterium]